MKDAKSKFHSTEMIVGLTTENNVISTSKVWYGGR
jgi:hypothetical protein